MKLYCLDKTTLSSDDSINAISWPHFSATRVLDESKFNLVKDLLYQIPAEFFVNDGKNIGCPDCPGHGGMFTEVEEEARGAYRIDLVDGSEQSAELISFKHKVLEAIKKLD